MFIVFGKNSNYSIIMNIKINKHNITYCTLFKHFSYKKCLNKNTYIFFEI